MNENYMARYMTKAESIIGTALCSMEVAGKYVTGLSDLGTMSAQLKEVMVQGEDYIGSGRGVRVKVANLDAIADRYWQRRAIADRAAIKQTSPQPEKPIRRRIRHKEIIVCG